MEFRFKQFAIRQDHCAMKVGTDGVLLGACVSIKGTELQVLDIGTGSGLIALMAAQRLNELNCHTFHIDGVEIDSEAAAQALENFEASPWRNHLQVHACSLAGFIEGKGAPTSSRSIKYDLMVCNPPFYNATLKPENKSRAIARHKDALPIKQIMSCAQLFLNETGRLALIYPMDYDGEVQTEALLAHLKPVRIVDIQTKIGKSCKRRICEFMHNHQIATLESSIMALRDESNEYSKEYRLLTEKFYLSLR